MKAVLWTDTFQFFVMVTGIIAVLVKVIAERETVKQETFDFVSID